MEPPDPLPLPAGDILKLELRSFNAWPAPHTLLMGGWAVRFGGGYTKRANSANAMREGATLDAAALAEIEQVYARQGQRCIFRISPLADPGADALLQAQGYGVHDRSLFMRRAARAADMQLRPVEVRESLGDAWFDGVCAANGLQREQRMRHRAILQAIGLRCGYGSVQRGGRAVAWGLAVLECRAVGFYDVAVAPEMRGQGLGRELMQGLLQWAASQGGASSDLQVAGGNAVAQALYASLGFEPVYGYHYRIKR